MNKQRLHGFVVSWAGRHERARSIAAAMADRCDRVTIVYSDPDPDFRLEGDFDAVRRPDDLFWADKFSACLQAFDGDLMLVVHADCDCDDWPGLVARCRSVCGSLPGIGVWAPRIEGTYYDLESTSILPLPRGNLRIVANTDGIVFCLAQPIVERMKTLRYDGNVYGWGIDWVFCAHAHATGRHVVGDPACVVRHPLGSGYDQTEARRQQGALLRRMTVAEAVQYRLLASFVRARKRVS